MAGHEITEVGRGESLRMLSMASDLGVGLPPGHGLRACYAGLRIAEELGLNAQEKRDLIHVGLLKDAGCTSWTTQIAAMIRGDEIAARREMLFFRELGDRRQEMGWAAKYVGAGAPLPARVGRLADFMVSGRDFMREGFQSGGEVACRIAERLGAPLAARAALASLFEQWNGKGMPRGLRGDAIPVLSRIVFATSYLEAARASGGSEAAMRIARERSGGAFDPGVSAAFARLGADETFWRALEDDSAGTFVEGHLREMPMAPLDEFAACCADFVDMKAYWLAGHSRRVAELGERVARRLRLPEADVRQVRIAGLVHDLGLVTIPSFVLNKPANEQSSAERAAIAAHGDTLRGDVRAVRRAGGDGRACLAPPRGRSRSQARGGEWRRARTGGRPRSGERVRQPHARFAGCVRTRGGEALALLTRRFVGGPFEAAAAALAAELNASRADAVGASGWPAGLTTREVEVLRHLASGKSRKEIAAELVVSESTVRSHLEHIYSKIDVSTRVGAVLFAIESGLLP